MGLGQQDGVRVGVHVDETGRDDAIGGIDLGVRLGAGQRLDGDDAIAGNADIGRKARALLSIDDRAVAYNQVKHALLGCALAAQCGCRGDWRAAWVESCAFLF